MNIFWRDIQIKLILNYVGPNTRIIATGGASANKAILQVLSDVFNSPVYVSVKKIILFIFYTFLELKIKVIQI